MDNNIALRNNWSYYNQAPPNTVLYSTDFKRHMPLLHENIPVNNVLRSKIKEYTIVIDSNDRDIVQYPNPFHYRVLIGPQIQQKITEYLRDNLGNVLKDPITKELLTSDTITSTPGPVIKDKIVWIKYIRLSNTILPRAYTMDINALKQGNNDCCFDTKSNLLDGDKSIQVHIKELSDQISPYKYSTNDSLSNSFAVLFDHNIINNHYFMSTHDGSGIEYDEPLTEFTNFTISIKDSLGKQLEYPFLKSCKCCNSHHCHNSCCNKLKLIDMISYGGSFAIDFEPIFTETIHIQCIIDTVAHSIKDSLYNLQYEFKKIDNSTFKIVLNGKYKNMTVNIFSDIKRTEDNTYEGNFKDNNNDINGIIKLVLQGDHISGVVNYTFGIMRIVIPFTLPITKASNIITCDHSVVATTYPSSILENIKIEYPINDIKSDDIIRINCKIGSILTLIATIDKKKSLFNGTLTGTVFKKYISLSIFIVNGAGSVVGTYGTCEVSLIIQFDNINGIFNIKGRIGSDLINYSYASPIAPITIFNWKQIFGYMTDKLNINKIIPLCLNVDKIDMNITPNNSMINVISFRNNVIVSELYQIEKNDDLHSGRDGQEKFIGSYNLNNKYRLPVETNKLNNMININYNSCSCESPNTTVVINKTQKQLLGKIMSGYPPILNFDFENVTNYEIVLTDVIRKQQYNLYGTIQNHFISMNDDKYDVSFGYIESVVDNSYNKKNCCDCIINPKDSRLQNQLHIKIGLVINDIPLLFNRQQ
jgi:hypothetical protein